MGRHIILIILVIYIITQKLNEDTIIYVHNMS